MVLRPVLLALALTGFGSTLHAQSPCPSTDLSAHEGSWQPRAGTPAVSQYRAPAGSWDRAAADAILDTVLGLIRAAYPQPRGGVAYFDRDLHFSHPYPGLPFGYSLDVGHSRFGCTGTNALVEGGETGVFIAVDVNTFRTAFLLSPVTAPTLSTFNGEVALHADEGGQYLLGGRRVYRIPVIAGEHRGVDRYTNQRHTGPGEPPWEQWFVIRRPDAPLFRYVTRREYAQQFRGELETSMARQIEAEREVGRLTGSSSAEAEAAVARITGAYLRAVDEYLRSAGEAELERPVHEFLSFFPRDPDNPRVEFADGDFALVHLDPDYMDARLPHHIPQFIVIRLGARGTPDAQAWERSFRERITEGLDFEGLKALIAR